MQINAKYLCCKNENIGEKTMNDKHINTKIIEQYRQCFKNTPVGTRLSRQEIINRINTAFGTNESNII